MTVDNLSVVKVAAAYSPIQQTEKPKTIPVALEAISTEAAAAAPLQGRVALHSEFHKALAENQTRLLEIWEAKRLRILLQTEVFCIGNRKVLLLEFVQALQAMFKNEIRLIGSSVGYVVTGKEEFRDIDLLNTLSSDLHLKQGWTQKDLQDAIKENVRVSAENARTLIESVAFFFYPKEEICALLTKLEKECDNPYLKIECKTAQLIFQYSPDLYKLILRKVYEKHFNYQCLINELYDAEKGGGNRFSLLKIGDNPPIEIKSTYNLNVYEEGKYLTTIPGLAKACAFSKDGVHIPLGELIEGETKIISLVCTIKEAVECLRQRLLIIKDPDGTEFIKWLDLITLRGFSCNQALKDETFENFLKKFSLDTILRLLERNFPETNNERRLPCLLNLKTLCKGVEKAHLLEEEVDKRISTSTVSDETLLKFFISNPELKLFDKTLLDIIINLIEKKIIKSHKQIEPYFKILDEIQRKKLCLSLIVFYPEIAHAFNAVQKLKGLENASVDLSYIHLDEINPERALELFSRIQNLEDTFLISLCFELLKVANPDDQNIFLNWLPKAYPSIQQKEELHAYLAKIGITIIASSTPQEVILSIILSTVPENGVKIFKHTEEQKLWGKGPERTKCLTHLIEKSHSATRMELWELITDRIRWSEPFLNAEEDPELISFYILKSSPKNSESLIRAFLKIFAHPPSSSNTLKLLKMALENKDFVEHHNEAISKLFVKLPEHGKQLLKLCRATHFNISIDIHSLTDKECQKLFHQIESFNDAYFDTLGIRLGKRLQITDQTLFIRFVPRGFFQLTPEEQSHFGLQNPKSPAEVVVQMSRSRSSHGFFLYQLMCSEKRWNHPSEKVEACRHLIVNSTMSERVFMWQSLEDKSLLLRNFLENETDLSCLSTYLNHPSLPLDETAAKALRVLFHSSSSLSKELFLLLIKALKNPYFLKEETLIPIIAILTPSQAREMLSLFKKFVDDVSVNIYDLLLEKGFSETSAETKEQFIQMLQWLPDCPKKLEIVTASLERKDFSVLATSVLDRYFIPDSYIQKIVFKHFLEVLEEYKTTLNQEFLTHYMLLFLRVQRCLPPEIKRHLLHKFFGLFSQLQEDEYNQKAVDFCTARIKEFVDAKDSSRLPEIQAFLRGCVRSRNSLFFHQATNVALHVKENVIFTTDVIQECFQIFLDFEPKRPTSDWNFLSFLNIFSRAFLFSKSWETPETAIAYFRNNLSLLKKYPEIKVEDPAYKASISRSINNVLRCPILRKILIQELDALYIIHNFAHLDEPHKRAEYAMESLYVLAEAKEHLPLEMYHDRLLMILNILKEDTHRATLDSECIIYLSNLYNELFKSKIKSPRKLGFLCYFRKIFIYSTSHYIKSFMASHADLVEEWTKDVDMNIKHIYAAQLSETHSSKIQKPYLTLLIASSCMGKFPFREIILRISGGGNIDLVEHTINQLHDLCCQDPALPTPPYEQLRLLFVFLPEIVSTSFSVDIKNILLKCLQIIQATKEREPSLIKLFVPAIMAFTTRFGEDQTAQVALKYFKEKLYQIAKE